MYEHWKFILLIQVLLEKTKDFVFSTHSSRKKHSRLISVHRVALLSVKSVRIHLGLADQHHPVSAVHMPPPDDWLVGRQD
jgi:hypothetical protein